MVNFPSAHNDEDHQKPVSPPPTEERLEKLERELTDLKAELAKRVRTGAVEVVDENGNVRALLFVHADGPSLNMTDAEGNPRAVLDGSGALNLTDAEGNSSVTLAVNAVGSGLALTDAEGELRASLAVTSAGPVLFFQNAAGQLVWTAP